MRISARNQIKGTVVDVKKGATTSHIRVDIGGGQIVASPLPNQAVDDLGIKAGRKATRLIKAPHVIISLGRPCANLVWPYCCCSELRPHGRRRNQAAATSSNGRSSASAPR